MSDQHQTIRDLVARWSLKLHRNVKWEAADYDLPAVDPVSKEPVPDREPTTDIDEAEAVSSKIGGGIAALRGYDDLPDEVRPHIVMLDIDVPAHLVPSSTEGHSHFYAEVQAPWGDICEFLDAAVVIGLVEEGYVAACKARGATSLRLPWIKKQPPTSVTEVVTPDPNLEF